MKKHLLVLLPVMLAGCVDLGRVGAHPSLKTEYFSGTVDQTYDCLSSEAFKQSLFLEEDSPYSNGEKRYNLVENGDVVAWLDMSHFSHHQSSVDAFYNKNEAGVAAKISAMFTECKRFLR